MPLHRVNRIIDPYKRVILIAIVVGIISGIGSLLFYEGLKRGTAFFMGYLMNYQMPVEGQAPGIITQWSAPANVFMFLPVLCFGALISGLLISYLALSLIHI